MPRFDMAVLVPKRDELFTVERFFQADFSTPVLELERVERPVYALELAGLKTAVVAIEGQGNTLAMSVTEHVITELGTPLVFLVGTALGNPTRSKLCSVVASEMVHDLTERRMSDGGVTFRGRIVEPAGRLRREVGRFHNVYDQMRMRAAVKDFATRQSIGNADGVIDEASVEFEHVCAGSDLVTGDFQNQIWSHDDRIACYDMESAGFAAGANQHNGVLWMVIRGVSDFGDTETKGQRHLRSLSMASATAFLRDFVTDGLKSCHPRTLHTPTSRTNLLNPDQHYMRFDGYGWFRKHVKERLDIALPSVAFGRDLTFDGFTSICRRRGMDASWLHSALAIFRQEYFEDKYHNYSYDQDIRGFIPGWSEEVHDIYRRLAIRLDVTDVLDVGCGNGLELRPLFDGAKSVTAVDISSRMLEDASRCFDGLRIVHTPAENLEGIETDSVDLYVSLRTYMSTFFNMRAAVAEAYRVLKPGGYIIVSIANGFLNTHPSGAGEVVRGLLVPGTHGIVDPHEPYRVQKRLREILTDFGFENIQLFSLATDVYIYAQVPSLNSGRNSVLLGSPHAG